MTKISTKLVGNKLVDRIAYQIVRFIVTTFCRVWCRMTVEGRENVPAEGMLHPGADPSQHHRHPDRIGRDPSPPALHGRRQVVEEQGVRQVVDRARRLPGQPRDRRSRGAEAMHRRAARRGAARAVPRGRAQVRADRAAAVRRRRPTSPSRPACRSCPWASVARSGRCQRAPSSSTPASCTSWSASRSRPRAIAASPKDQRDAARQLTAESPRRTAASVRHRPGPRPQSITSEVMPQTDRPVRSGLQLRTARGPSASRAAARRRRLSRCRGE